MAVDPAPDDVTPTRPSVQALLQRCRALAGGGRRILGITGAPGAGKSTLAAQLIDGLGPATARLVPMDGFHLSNAVLHALGIHEVKGAPDTFDVDGYLALLRRLRAVGDEAEDIVYAPLFDRDLEESIGSAQPVPASVPLVITEGNYLLYSAGRWREVRALLDECWFLDPGEDVRTRRLVERHIRYGRSPQEARARCAGSDQHNATLVAATRDRSDLVIAC